MEAKESKDRLRFGIPVSTSYGSTGSGVSYGNNGMGYVMQPVKIDIGGIALGALIGLGAVLIVPKIAHILSTGYGYRSKYTLSPKTSNPGRFSILQALKMKCLH